MPRGCPELRDKHRPAHCLQLGPQEQRWYLGWIVSMNLIIAAGAAAGIVFWRWKSGRRPVVLEDEEGSDTKSADLLLEIVSGSAIKYKIQGLCNGPPITIGRLAENYLAIPNDHVSGEHARLEWDPDTSQWVLWDTGSMNGTALNDITVSNANRTVGAKHNVKPGDTITLAERISIAIKPLGTVSSTPDRDPETSIHHKVAPSSGSMHAPGPQAPVSLMDPNGPGQKPRPQTYQFYCPGLHASVSIAAQVGSSHWQFSGGSQDVAFWEAPFANFSQAGLFSVCDGHVGDSTSMELRDELPQALGSRFKNEASLLANGGDLTKVLNDFFPSLDRELKSLDGSTATVMLAERLRDGSCAIQVANVGDSACILLGESGDHKVLTGDHRVVAPAETERLKESNAPISPRGTRLHSLNLARAMGDHDLKKMSATLISVPSVSEVVRIPKDKSAIVVMASDGLWDGIRLAQATEILQSDHPEDETHTDDLMTLISQSVSKGVTDDITAMLIHFLPEHQGSTSKSCE